MTGDERITSALPDFQGRIWFVTKKNGKVGTLDTKTGEITCSGHGEEIENSFAVDKDGVYIVSDKRMYRFSAGRERPAAGRLEGDATATPASRSPSQVDAGSGTTPTILNGGYVAITDNADPMNVVVYRTARAARRRSASSARSGVQQGRERDRELAASARAAR